MKFYDKNKRLGVSGASMGSCTQLCYDFDGYPSIPNPIPGHTYYLHSSVRSNLCYSNKQWVISKTIGHLTSLLTYTKVVPSRVIVHYGKKGTCGDGGLRRMLGNLSNVVIPTDSVLDRPLLLENAAGQGTEIGTSIEEMRFILESYDKSHLIGTCLDTCHAYAYGYDLSVPSVLESLIETIETFSSIKLIHLNDCVGVLGCRVDRHQNIGYGNIWKNGTESLDLLFSICSEKRIDMILETPNPVQDFQNLQPFLQLKRRK
jgi:apurinic endonuclease APN1